MAELATTLVATEADRLDQAEAVVRSYCGWHIAPSRTETATVEGGGSPVLLLPSLHVTAVASITDDDGNSASTDWRFQENGVILGRTWGDRPYSVVFTHGYAEVPADVTGVVQALAQRMVASSAGRTVSNQNAGPFAVGYDPLGADGFLPSERLVLDRYKLPPRP